MCLEKSIVESAKVVYEDILSRCKEVLEWKNSNNCSLSLGGRFDVDKPLFIVCFHSNGVIVTNNEQCVLVTNSELESDRYKENCESILQEYRRELKKVD